MDEVIWNSYCGSFFIARQYTWLCHCSYNNCHHNWSASSKIHRSCCNYTGKRNFTLSSENLAQITQFKSHFLFCLYPFCLKFLPVRQNCINCLWLLVLWVNQVEYVSFYHKKNLKKKLNCTKQWLSLPFVLNVVKIKPVSLTVHSSKYIFAILTITTMRTSFHIALSVDIYHLPYCTWLESQK